MYVGPLEAGADPRCIVGVQWAGELNAGRLTTQWGSRTGAGLHVVACRLRQEQQSGVL